MAARLVSRSVAMLSRVIQTWLDPAMLTWYIGPYCSPHSWNLIELFLSGISRALPMNGKPGKQCQRTVEAGITACRTTIGQSNNGAEIRGRSLPVGPGSLLMPGLRPLPLLTLSIQAYAIYDRILATSRPHRCAAMMSWLRRCIC